MDTKRSYEMMFAEFLDSVTVVHIITSRGNFGSVQAGQVRLLIEDGHDVDAADGGFARLKKELARAYDDMPVATSHSKQEWVGAAIEQMLSKPFRGEMHRTGIPNGRSIVFIKVPARAPDCAYLRMIHRADIEYAMDIGKRIDPRVLSEYLNISQDMMGPQDSDDLPTMR